MCMTIFSDAWRVRRAGEVRQGEQSTAAVIGVRREKKEEEEEPAVGAFACQCTPVSGESIKLRASCGTCSSYE